MGKFLIDSELEETLASKPLHGSKKLASHVLDVCQELRGQDVGNLGECLFKVSVLFNLHTGLGDVLFAPEDINSIGIYSTNDIFVNKDGYTGIYMLMLDTNDILISYEGE